MIPIKVGGKTFLSKPASSSSLFTLDPTLLLLLVVEGMDEVDPELVVESNISSVQTLLQPQLAELESLRSR